MVLIQEKILFYFKHPIWEKLELGGTETHISHNLGEHLNPLDHQVHSIRVALELV